ncbi:prolyl 4-hydroxylase subunit alpha-1-like isoform X2 [Uloborus diversus]|nr:prolyl 4-hydroxylase subunit alpha-1-like isoform X2 [Uloborus diversus]
MKCYYIITTSSFFISSIFLVLVKSELFTALVDLEKLLYTEGEIVRTLEKYLEFEEQRLEKVKWLSREYEKLHNVASKDVETFLSNPVNAYLLVKRLTADWKTAENLIDGSHSRAIIENITRQEDLKFPDEEDLSGAASALMRLQDTYLLDTSTLARGEIQGTSPSAELSAGDCFELGRQAYNDQDFYHTLLWMQESLDRLEDEEIKTSTKPTILEYMAYSTYMLGNLRHALKLTKELISIDPTHPRALGNLRYYQDAVSKEEDFKRGDDGDASNELQTFSRPKESTSTEKDIYESLCRGERTMSLKEESKLYCQYVTNNNSYLLLQPVKEEVLFLRPRIVVYHGILSDNEMEVIKQLAQPRLARATVQNSKSGELEIASYRISKSAWLKDNHHKVIARVSRRIKEITGLETNTAEELQVVNYGIGGHYEPHYDFARKEEKNAFKSLGTGNRIATWINYMSDVDAGGATVFPEIGVSVKPIKGSAGFWYNLFRSGDGDFATRHAACPVLAGSKWVSNKWIHEHGQEFRRPCGLSPNE